MSDYKYEILDIQRKSTDKQIDKIKGNKNDAGWLCHDALAALNELPPELLPERILVNPETTHPYSEISLQWKFCTLTTKGRAVVRRIEKPERETVGFSNLTIKKSMSSQTYHIKLNHFEKRGAVFIDNRALSGLDSTNEKIKLENLFWFNSHPRSFTDVWSLIWRNLVEFNFYMLKCYRTSLEETTLTENDTIDLWFRSRENLQDLRS